MTNKCTYGPTYETTFIYGMIFGFDIIFGIYDVTLGYYFYGIGIGLFGRGLFIGVKKVCR